MRLNFHHVALTVNNLNESVEWYQNKLGCHVVKRYDKGDMRIALLSLGDFYIELFRFDKTKPLPDFCKELMSDLGVMGTKHIGLLVDDLDGAIIKLKQQGVRFVTDPDATFYGGKYVFFKDCNGILIELYESKQ